MKKNLFENNSNSKYQISSDIFNGRSRHGNETVSNIKYKNKLESNYISPNMERYKFNSDSGRRSVETDLVQRNINSGKNLNMSDTMNKINLLEIKENKSMYIKPDEILVEKHKESWDRMKNISWEENLYRMGHYYIDGFRRCLRSIELVRYGHNLRRVSLLKEIEALDLLRVKLGFLRYKTDNCVIRYLQDKWYTHEKYMQDRDYLWEKKINVLKDIKVLESQIMYGFDIHGHNMKLCLDDIKWFQPVLKKVELKSKRYSSDLSWLKYKREYVEGKLEKCQQACDKFICKKNYIKESSYNEMMKCMLKKRDRLKSIYISLIESTTHVKSESNNRDDMKKLMPEQDPKLDGLVVKTENLDEKICPVTSSVPALTYSKGSPAASVHGVMEDPNKAIVQIDDTQNICSQVSGTTDNVSVDITSILPIEESSHSILLEDSNLNGISNGNVRLMCGDLISGNMDGLEDNVKQHIDESVQSVVVEVARANSMPPMTDGLISYEVSDTMDDEEIEIVFIRCEDVETSVQYKPSIDISTDADTLTQEFSEMEVNLLQLCNITSHALEDSILVVSTDEDTDKVLDDMDITADGTKEVTDMSDTYTYREDVTNMEVLDNRSISDAYTMDISDSYKDKVISDDYADKDIHIVHNTDYTEVDLISVDTHIKPYTENYSLTLDSHSGNTNNSNTNNSNHTLVDDHIVEISNAALVGIPNDISSVHGNNALYIFNGTCTMEDFEDNKSFKYIKSRYGFEGILMKTRLYF